MLTTKIFKGDYLDKDGNFKVKEVNIDFFKKLKDIALKDREENILQNKDVIRRFVAGDQWDFKKQIKSSLVYNAFGQSIYDFSSTFQSDGADANKRPRRTHNITKSTINKLVSYFVQKSPLPVARAKSDYNYDKEILHKINLLLKIIFHEENDLEELYEILAKETLVDGYCFVQIKIDEDKSNTVIPIKIRYIDPVNVYVDPEATKIDEADYFIQTLKLKYWELKELTDYTSDYKKTEPDDMDIVEVDIYWIRAKDKLGKNKWINFWIYENKWIKLVDREDKDRKPLEQIIYDDLPFEIFRGEVLIKWYGTSLAKDIIPINVEINKLLSSMDWNWMMFADPPTLGINIDLKSMLKARKPGGHYTGNVNQRISPLLPSIGYISAGDYNARYNMLKQDLTERVGNLGVLSGGENPVGTYSGAKLNALQQSAAAEPNMIEKKFLKTFSRIAEKALRLLANYIEGRAISIWDPDYENEIKDKSGNVIKKTYGKMIQITSDDIINNLYKIEIQTKDANLLSKEAKWNIIKEYMQYAKIQEYMPFYMLIEWTNETIPGLFPEKMIEELRKDYELQLQAKALQNQQLQAQMGMQEQQITNQGIPEQGTQMIEENNEEKYPPEFWEEVEKKRQELEDNGIPSEKIDQIFNVAVDEEINNNTPYEEILNYLEELVNKTIMEKNNRR